MTYEWYKSTNNVTEGDPFLGQGRRRDTTTAIIAFLIFALRDPVGDVQSLSELFTIIVTITCTLMMYNCSVALIDGRSPLARSVRGACIVRGSGLGDSS